MTDHCKESPTGRHMLSTAFGPICRYCCRTVDYLRDLGWNVPAQDPDLLPDATAGWRDEEADVNTQRTGDQPV